MRSYRIGAAFYVLWGLTHAAVGAVAVAAAVRHDYPAAMAVLANAAESITRLDPAVGGVLAQNGWNLFWSGVFAILVAVRLNWKNDRLGYWLNLILVSLVDLGFVLFVVAPGYITLTAGLPGPALWGLAVIFSTIGMFKSR